jgi:hypothetical protein
MASNANNPLREILVLGVQGSGKTTLLAVLGHRFKESGIFGLGMTSVNGTDTLRFVDDKWHLMTRSLSTRAFPAATDPDSAAEYLSWDVNVGTKLLFRLSTLDCGGEAIYRVFTDFSSSNSELENESDASSTQRNQLRKMAKRASVLCLFVRPSDFEPGSDKHPDAPADVRERSRKTVETVLAVVNGKAGKEKRLLIVLTDTQSYADDIERAGGPKAWLFAEIPELKRSARAVASNVIATVAVRETIKNEKGVEVPADNFSSDGLESFLLAVGVLMADDLKPVGKAILSLCDAGCAYAETKAHPSASQPLERFDAGQRFAECGKRFRAEAKELLSKFIADHEFGAGSNIRTETEKFITQIMEEPLRAEALEGALEQALLSLPSQGTPPLSWDVFRKGIFEEALKHSPDDRRYAESDLPTAREWFCSARKGLRQRARERLWRLTRNVISCCIIVVVAAFVSYEVYDHWKTQKSKIEQKRRGWESGKETDEYPHVLTGPTYDAGYVAMPGWELDDPHKPHNATWLPGWKPSQNAKIQAGRKPDEWTCDPGYERMSVGVAKTLSDLETQWKRNARHPSIKNIHAGDNAGEWLPDPGYESVDRNDILKKGVQWKPDKVHDDFPMLKAKSAIGCWEADPGYVIDDPTKPETVKWVPGTPWPGNIDHPANPHIVASAFKKGGWYPAPGYIWINVTNKWKGVKWNPNKRGTDWPAIGSKEKLSPHVKTGAKEGKWVADPGYVLDDVSNPATLRWKSGITHPQNNHLVADSVEGKWIGAETGWVWTGGAKAEWRSGIPHPKYPHVETSDIEGILRPEAGYDWVDKKISLEVKRKNTPARGGRH